MASANRADWSMVVGKGDHVMVRLGEGPRDAFVTEVLGGQEEGPDDERSLLLKHAYLLPTPPPSVDVEDERAPPNLARKRSRGVLRLESLPTVFNLACVLQEEGEVEAARELLTAIVHMYPSYVAAYLKLAVLAQVGGRVVLTASSLAECFTHCMTGSMTCVGAPPPFHRSLSCPGRWMATWTGRTDSSTWPRRSSPTTATSPPSQVCGCGCVA